MNNVKAKTIKRFFSRETSVTIAIKSSPRKLWEILTNAKNYPRWNSTVVSIEGDIALGQKIKLISYLDPKRVFTLTISELEIDKRLAHSDPMGRRVFTLTPLPNGETQFSMTEKIGGALFPLFARMIPPFDESFDKFAHDLKIEAEKNQ